MRAFEMLEWARFKPEITKASAPILISRNRFESVFCIFEIL